MAARVPIRFDAWYRVLSSMLFLPPSASYVEVADGQVHARMGWGFRASFPLAAVVATSALDSQPLSRGVHGWAGRWLVNGAGDGIVVIDLEPTQRAWVMGFPVRLRQLMVSVENPPELRRILRRSPQP
jgi:hypothetical protein